MQTQGSKASQTQANHTWTIEKGGDQIGKFPPNTGGGFSISTNFKIGLDKFKRPAIIPFITDWDLKRKGKRNEKHNDEHKPIDARSEEGKRKSFHHLENEWRFSYNVGKQRRTSFKS
jgi:hypothetical protein